MKKIFFLSLILPIICFFPINIYASTDQYTWSTFDLATEVSNSLNTASISDSENPLNLECGSCILMEQHTGKILYSYNPHEQLRPASVTKLMSIYLIMEALSQGKINYDTKIPCSENAESMGGSQIWLTTTENLTVDEMLKAICVVSANDCVTAMAEFLGGTEENFVNMMNEKAKELNMKDTCFKNCHGIDEDGHVMSAYDIAILSCALLNDYPEITKYTTIYMDSLRDGKSSLVNTNKLVRNYSGCTGLKTGSTSLALYNLSASASKNGMDLVAVVMKAPTSTIRFKNASNLLDYGFTNFEYKQLINKNDIVKTISVPKGVNSPIELQAETDCGVILSKGKDTNIEQVVSVANNIEAPISKGDELGKITYILDGETIAECSLVASQNVPKINIFSMEQNIFKNWATLLR